MSALRFGVDYLGLLLGAGVVLLGLASTSPYCDVCKRYMSQLQTLHLDPTPEAAAPEPPVVAIFREVGGGRYRESVSLIDRLAEAGADAVARLEVQEFRCEGCRRGSMLLRLQKKSEKGEWEADGDVQSVHSHPQPAPTLVLR